MSQSTMRKSLPVLLPLLFTLVLTLSSCSSSKSGSSSEPEVSPSEVRYRQATELVAKKRYDDAVFILESLMFSTRATDLEDDVLNTLAEAYFQSKQYMLSADIYNRLLQQTPDSPFARNAQLQLAKSYEKLSAFYERDQEYTAKAINEFGIFLDQYPEPDNRKATSEAELYRELMKVNPSNLSYKEKYEAAMAELSKGSYVQEIKASIAELRNKIAQNRYSIARQYIKLEKLRAAEIFFNLIIERYSDTKWVEPAWHGKIDTQIARNKWFEARQSIERYQQLFPDNVASVEPAYKKVLANLAAERQSQTIE